REIILRLVIADEKSQVFIVQVAHVGLGIEHVDQALQTVLESESEHFHIMSGLFPGCLKLLYLFFRIFDVEIGIPYVDSSSAFAVREVQIRHKLSDARNTISVSSDERIKKEPIGTP